MLVYYETLTYIKLSFNISPLLFMGKCSFPMIFILGASMNEGAKYINIKEYKWEISKIMSSYSFKTIFKTKHQVIFLSITVSTCPYHL